MRGLCLLLSLIVAATAPAEPLRLILAPQQLVIPPDWSPIKFDLYLYNDGNAAEVVPSLEQFRAVYIIRHFTDNNSQKESQLRTFSHPIKDHTLKAKRLDHATVDIDFSSVAGEYIELSIEIGDKRLLTSNSVLLLCSPLNASPTVSPSSPAPTVTPKP